MPLSNTLCYYVKIVIKKKKQNVTLISKTSQIFLKYDFENKKLNDLFANDLIGNQTHKNTKKNYCIANKKKITKYMQKNNKNDDQCFLK